MESIDRASARFAIRAGGHVRERCKETKAGGYVCDCRFVRPGLLALVMFLLLFSELEKKTGRLRGERQEASDVIPCGSGTTRPSVGRHAAQQSCVDTEYSRCTTAGLGVAFFRGVRRVISSSRQRWRVVHFERRHLPRVLYGRSRHQCLKASKALFPHRLLAAVNSFAARH